MTTEKSILDIPEDDLCLLEHKEIIAGMRAIRLGEAIDSDGDKLKILMATIVEHITLEGSILRTELSRKLKILKKDYDRIVGNRRTQVSSRSHFLTFTYELFEKVKTNLWDIRTFEMKEVKSNRNSSFSLESVITEYTNSFENWQQPSEEEINLLTEIHHDFFTYADSYFDLLEIHMILEVPYRVQKNLKHSNT